MDSFDVATYWNNHQRSIRRKRGIIDWSNDCDLVDGYCRLTSVIET